MYFVKGFVNGSIVRIAITKQNTFTLCPAYQKEHIVDLSEIFKKKNSGLYGSTYCPECTKRRNEDENKSNQRKSEKAVYSR